ncbi:MAG: PilZ domain-containing protein, partial [Nitrospirota bacterium]
NVSDMVICLINNISKGGMGAFSTVPLQAGDRVTIRRMNMSALVSEDVITGTIVWVAGKDRSYNMGICFNEELSKGTNPELYKVLFEERYGVRQVRQ